MPIADGHGSQHVAVMTKVNFIVTADEPAIFFASVQEAESWMEPIDVQNGVFKEAYGPAGEPYSISTDGSCVSIEPTGEAPKAEELRYALLEVFAALGNHSSDHMTLSELLDRCVPRP